MANGELSPLRRAPRQEGDVSNCEVAEAAENLDGRRVPCLAVVQSAAQEQISRRVQKRAFRIRAEPVRTPELRS